MKPISLFETTTARGAITTGIVSLFIAILPSVDNILQRNYPERKDDISDVIEIVSIVGGFIAVGGTGVALTGRASAKSLVYTPNWLPGYNKNELEEAYDNIQSPKDDIVINKNPNATEIITPTPTQIETNIKEETY